MCSLLLIIKGLVSMTCRQNTKIVTGTKTDHYLNTQSAIESILALKPDARPLYRYRISYSQLLHLQAYLSENHLSFYDVDEVTKFSSDLDKLFLLYATE